MHKSEGHGEFFSALENDWEGEYTTGQDPVLSIVPQDVANFMNDFTVDFLTRPGAAIDAPYDPNKRPIFSQAAFHNSLQAYVDLPSGHAEGVIELGRQAAVAFPEGEVGDRMFGWGYNLYWGILHREAGIEPPKFTPEEILEHAFSMSDNIIDAIEVLAVEAELKLKFLCRVTDDLLDDLVEIHNVREFIDDDQFTRTNFEHMLVRRKRLKVVTAGLGLAYAVAAESFWQQHQGQSSQPGPFGNDMN